MLTSLKRLVALALVALVTACAGGYASVRYGVHYGHHGYYGAGPWGGYRDTIIVVPDRPDPDGDLEAVPLPEPPPDMGMPDMDFGDMDFGGMDY